MRICARCAGFGGASASGMSCNRVRAWLQRGGGRGRLAAPMYDVGCTTEADGVCLCTIYDVRCTTRTTAPMREHALAGGKCVWTVRMRCPAGANWQCGASESTRTTAPSSCEAAAHVRCTTRTTAVSAYGQRACAARRGENWRRLYASLAKSVAFAPQG